MTKYQLSFETLNADIATPVSAAKFRCHSAAKPVLVAKIPLSTGPPNLIQPIDFRSFFV
jgi:hypothetical protein